MADYLTAEQRDELRRAAEDLRRIRAELLGIEREEKHDKQWAQRRNACLVEYAEAECRFTLALSEDGALALIAERDALTCELRVAEEALAGAILEQAAQGGHDSTRLLAERGRRLAEARRALGCPQAAPTVASDVRQEGAITCGKAV